MFYEPQNGHGLPHNPFSAVIAPRPIAWVATRGAIGDNLAPYSFFNAAAYEPPQIMFASTSSKPDRDGTKDTMANIRDTGVFCVNIVGMDLIDPMNRSSRSLAADQDEFQYAGLKKAECETIDCPRVADTPAALECKLVQIITLPGETNLVCFGQVTGVHIRDDCLVDGRFDFTHAENLARLGYRDYLGRGKVFELGRPDDK